MTGSRRRVIRLPALMMLAGCCGSGFASSRGPEEGAPAPGRVVYGSVRAANLGHGADLNGSIPFPEDNPWNADVSGAPVDPNSDRLIASIGLSAGIHPDFGAGLYEGAPIGIPYVVVGGLQPRVAIHFTTDWRESDPGPFPIPADARVEGERPDAPGSGVDRHVIVVDRDNDRLYELYRAFRNDDGSWSAAAAACFHLDSNQVRLGGRPGWTSADAAGLPIFPGLVRHDEAARGVIRHALRFTAALTRRAWLPPATHFASTLDDPDRPPMGMRVRLKADCPVPSSFSVPVRAILQAMKTHGMILADNGANWTVSGAPDERWDNRRLLRELRQVRGSDFEVIRMEGLVVPER